MWYSEDDCKQNRLVHDHISISMPCIPQAFENCIYIYTIQPIMQNTLTRCSLCNAWQHNPKAQFHTPLNFDALYSTGIQIYIYIYTMYLHKNIIIEQL